MKDHPAVAPDARNHGQRMHDALEDVCDRLLRGSRHDRTIPDAGGTPATVIITFNIEDLLADTGYGVTSDGTLIRTDQVLQLADQADIYLAAVDRNGVVLNLGRMRRIATLGQTIALDRPRQRLLLPRLRHTPGMVRTPPHPGLDRRRRHQPEQSDLALPLPPPQLRQPAAGPAGSTPTDSPNGPHPASSTGSNAP